MKSIVIDPRYVLKTQQGFFCIYGPDIKKFRMYDFKNPKNHPMRCMEEFVTTVENALQEEIVNHSRRATFTHYFNSIQKFLIQNKLGVMIFVEGKFEDNPDVLSQEVEKYFETLMAQTENTPLDDNAEEFPDNGF
jgi:hypothetical protein